MAVDLSADFLVNFLLEKLRLDDPWVPPRSWDSLSLQGGASSHAPPNSSSNKSTAPVVSEPSLVKLALNALQGVETALISIEKLSIILCNTTADRTRPRIPSLWTRCSSTSAVGNLLSSIGRFGCTVFLLRRFVDYFTFGGRVEAEENPTANFCEESNRSLVNLAFAIAVGKVLDGYVSGLNTLYASIRLRRSLTAEDGGCLSSIEHSKITLLEVHNHTVGLRTQIEALGNLCNVTHLTHEYPASSLEELRIRAYTEFSVFPISGALLSFLYAKLKVADPDHCALLKFLFLQSYEPYCEFIRSWIFKGLIGDTYSEFVIESVYDPPSNDMENPSCSPLPTVRVRDGVVLPCFLEECLVPLCRSGQQLQMIMKLLELCNNVGTFGAREAILPCLDDLCHKYPAFASPLTFDKVSTETLSRVRSNYYEQMLEKAEGSLARFDFISRPAISRRPTKAFGKGLVNQASSVVHESLSPSDTINTKTADNAEASSFSDEDSYVVDGLESSDEFSEDENDVEQVNDSDSEMPCYLSVLDFLSSSSYDIPTKKLKQNGVSSSTVLVASNLNERCGHAADSSRIETHFVDSKQKPSQSLETVVTSPEHNLSLLDGARFRRGENETWLLPRGRELELSMRTSMAEVDLYSAYASEVKAGCKNPFPNAMRALSATSTLQFSRLKYDSSRFSMNPAVGRGSFFDMRTVRKEYHTNQLASNFDFSSVEDPLKSYSVKFDLLKVGTTPSVLTEAVDIGLNASNLVGVNYCGNAIPNDVRNCGGGSPSHREVRDEGRILIPNTSGGSSWESLLGRSGYSVDQSTGDHIGGLIPGAGMPPDFVIKRCLLDEILLQYKYVSKLTIRLLVEGFKLQEHFQALQSYHFMEVADWADLFIMSLWRRKWVVNEVDKRIPEIQGILEMALQRSSREGDSNKDRLYVYLKRDAITHLSSSFIGISSFDFMGLGYQIEWPINIILTSGALQIYSDIFNFLIKVKLAVFSLSDAWCTLKGCRSKRDIEVQKFSILTETRHKINHFVSSLQQYIQSQLSQVSWLKFRLSLEHKVKDMLDLESVHMAYLTESLHSCFLSDETKTIAGIIQNILQCAMDFGSCLMLTTGSNAEDSSQRFSQMNFSQVHSIRRTFHKNLTDLHSINLHSSKHGESGISRFWDYLDYNEYYAGVMSKQKGPSII